MKDRLIQQSSIVIGLLLLLQPFSNTYAANYQSHKSIFSAARQFVEQKLAGRVAGRIEVTPGYLDQRLNLAQCSQDLTTFLPSGTDVLRSNTIDVRCDGKKRWSIFAPVKLRIMLPILVANQPLVRQQILRKGDFSLVETNITNLTEHYFQHPREILGKAVKRHIRAGIPISQRDITEPTDRVGQSSL